MKRVCDRCKREQEAILRRLTVEYSDRTSITVRLCRDCYAHSVVTLRTALLGRR